MNSGACYTGRREVPGVAWRAGRNGWIGAAAVLVVPLGLAGGCSSAMPSVWGSAPRVEVHWYTPSPEEPPDAAPAAQGDSWVRLRNVSLVPETPPETTAGERRGSFTVTTLHPGRTYDFEYVAPHRPEELTYGQMWVHDPCAPWASKFVRHSYLVVNPTSAQGRLGHASILTDEDLDRALAGDVVEKVVFVADLRAIDRRLAMIERELRRIQDFEARLLGQLDYWNTKRADRRRNAFYGEEYGVDVPAAHLGLLQALVGAESYHWLRYTEADDEVRTYEEEIARLALPVKRLYEERVALRAMLTSAKVIHRRGEMMLATFDMTRRYHDAAEEITEVRDTLHGPNNALEDPYAYSGLTKVAKYIRLLSNKTGMPERRERVGELVLVMRIGPRELHPLTASGWLALWSPR